MVDQRKRGFSSFSDDSTDSNEGGIKKILKYLLPKSFVERSGKNSTKSTSSLNDQTASIIQNDPLVNDFSGRNGNFNNKYSRTDSIPRSGSGLHSDLFYENLQNKVNEENDFERRPINGCYQGALIKPDSKDMHATSPSGFNFLDTLNREDSGRPEHPENSFESEIAPFYGVSEEGLVRPPLINLDPRERFYLLQIKKSLETTEALQNRLKYMVDPQETQSFTVSDNNNKIDSSTQTRDQDFLDNALISNHLNRKRRIQTEDSMSKRPKNSRGYFSGDFFYDDIDSKKGNEVEGKTFLGSLNKPKFTNKENKRETTDDELYNRYSENNMKTTTERTGLDDLLLKNQKAKVTLDPDFLKHTQKVADAIKLRDVKNDSRRREPSPGFNFTINENDIASAFKKRPSPNKDEHLETRNGKEDENKSGLFKEAPQNSHVKPLFSENKQGFGKANETSGDKPSFFAQLASKVDGDKEQKHSEGKISISQQENGNAPSLSNFGNNKLNVAEVSEKKKVSSEDEQSRKRTAVAPSDTSKPLFSFSDQNKKTSNDGFASLPPKDTSSITTQSNFPSTLFGQEKKNKDFSSGDKIASDKETPFPPPASRNGTPFGKTSQDASKDTNKLPFPFSFGSLAKKPSEEPLPRDKSPAADQPKSEPPVPSQPAFPSFLSANKADEEQAKPFSFPPKPKESSPSVPSSQFTFGAPSGQSNSQTGTSPAPSFNFTGMIGKGPSPDPASIFGGVSNQPFSAPPQSTATPPPAANQFQPPSGLFAPAASSNAPPSFPNYTFGAPQPNAFPPTTSSSTPPNLRTSTPPFNRKIAQIRRRR